MALEKKEQEVELYEEKSAMEQAMTSEEHQNEGTFLSGGNDIEAIELAEEREFDEAVLLTPRKVKGGAELLNFLRANLHKFESPHTFLGGEANSPDRERFKTAEIRILIARLSSYEAVSLSMTHSLMAQIYSELPYTFIDLAFMPKPKDYEMLRSAGFPVWFGTNTKLTADKFDVLSISHAVNMEQINFIPLMHDSGIPIFKEQRMEREDIPLIICGGANSGTTAPLNGSWTFKDGRTFSTVLDAVIYGDGEEAAKQFIDLVREGKQKGWSKREILRAAHGRVSGFYEPDCYEHTYDGKSRIKSIVRREGREYAELPVRRATVKDLNTVRTLETKILPYTGDGTTVDVAIAGSVGCIGSGGFGACSFCREGSEGPYRERSLTRVMEALERATKNQGTKEASFFSLNFNQYNDFFPLIHAAVAKGYKLGLISQRIDMLAETPEQIRVQRYLKKKNYTLGVEGISSRMRAFLNKNLSEEELLKVCAEFIKEGASELKLFMIATGMESEVDIKECGGMMEKVTALRDKMGANTRFRLSFTPLFPAAFTALQFAPVLAALKHGQKSLTPVFEKAKSLGWGRRLSVSGEEPLISNTISHGGRSIFPLLIMSHFVDDYRFYGRIPKGVWARWEKRAKKLPNVDYEVLWGEKDFEYIFPWEDIAYSTSKEALWRGYAKAVAFQGIAYCLTTRSVKGICHVNECGACDPDKTGSPDPILIKNIVGRKTAQVITAEKIAQVARGSEKTQHIRLLLSINDPIYRFVAKGYFNFAVPRALMQVSDEFYQAFSHPLGHARSQAGANMMKDWTFGHNIYDFAMMDVVSQKELDRAVPLANEVLREGKILAVRADSHIENLKTSADFAIYSMLVPNSAVSFQRISHDVARHFEREELGKQKTIKIKKAYGKGMYKTVEVDLSDVAVRLVEYQFAPEHRGTILRFVISTKYNPFSMLETLTERRAGIWKQFPIFCDGYVAVSKDTGERDVFAALSGEQDWCNSCGGALESDLFTGNRLEKGVCLSCSLDQFPVREEVFFSQEMQAVS